MRHKCIFTSIDNKIKKYRPCKAYHLRYSSACLTHSRIHVILIQSYWRKYKINKKIIHFKKLPNDIWNNIMFYIRYDHYIKHKLLPSYLRIYIKRYNNLILSSDNNNNCTYTNVLNILNKIESLTILIQNI